jgi:hypothetical protein
VLFVVCWFRVNAKADEAAERKRKDELAEQERRRKVRCTMAMFVASPRVGTIGGRRGKTKSRFVERSRRTSNNRNRARPQTMQRKPPPPPQQQQRRQRRSRNFVVDSCDRQLFISPFVSRMGRMPLPDGWSEFFDESSG